MLLETGPQIFGSRADTFFALVRYWVRASDPPRSAGTRPVPSFFFPLSLALTPADFFEELFEITVECNIEIKIH